MYGKPHPEGFRTVLHPDRVCRAAFWIQTAVDRRRRGPNGNQVFSVTLRRRRHDLKKAQLPVPPQKADPACSSFARLCVSGGQFVSSGHHVELKPERLVGVVEGGAKSGHLAATDQGPQTLILG